MPLADGSMEAGARALVRVRTHVREDLLELTEDGWDILLHRVPDNVGIHMTIVMHDPMANARDGGPMEHRDTERSMVGRGARRLPPRR